MIEALVDTGSCVSLVKNIFVESLGLRPTHMRNLPRLTGVTQTTLPVLGSVYLNAFIGTKVVKHLFAVVPDGLLDTEVLLGADLLSTAPITWDYKQGKITWDDCTYPVRLLKPRPSTKRVKKVKLGKSSDPLTVQVRLKKKLILPPASAGIYAVTVNEPQDTVLEFESVLKLHGASNALCLQVNADREVHIPFVNSTKNRISLKIGTLIGTFNKIDERDIISPVPRCKKVEIKNYLIPESVHVTSEQGSREERLVNLISQQDFSHLSEEQQDKLKNMLVANHLVFILKKNELGKIEGVQGHITVSDLQPVRSSMYRYPEKAKQIIADMLEDMEAKDIIEPSTAVWLSPIVLVRKPDNSQRMCLDYRKVNTHLQTDIHPLPRLDELVESASGNQYYASLDMKEAYYQVELSEESRDLTAFSDEFTYTGSKDCPLV